ncbi:MAG: hypothetical protein [Cotesia congregata filamentous virus 2]
MNSDRALLLKYSKLEKIKQDNDLFKYYPQLFEMFKSFIFENQDGEKLLNIRTSIDINALAILQSKIAHIVYLYEYMLRENLKRYSKKQNNLIELTDENAEFAYNDLTMRKNRTEILLKKFTRHLNLLLNHQKTLLNYGNNELNRLYMYIDYYILNSNTYYEKISTDVNKILKKNNALKNIHIPNPLSSIKFTFKDMSNNNIFLNKFFESSNTTGKLILYCNLLKMFLLCREYDIRYGKNKLIGYYIHKESVTNKLGNNDFINNLITCNFWLPFTIQ